MVTYEKLMLLFKRVQHLLSSQEDLEYARIVNETGTSYTLKKEDAINTVIRIDNAGAITLNLPDDDEVYIPVGSTIEAVEVGAGVITAAAPGTATVSGTTATTGANSRLIVRKIAANTWEGYVG